MEVASVANLDKRKQESIYTSTWLSVGISSNNDYPGQYYPEGQVLGMENRHYKYKRADRNEYGLETYVPINVDEEARRKGGGAADMFDYNVYYHKDESTTSTRTSGASTLLTRQPPAGRCSIFILR